MISRREPLLWLQLMAFAVIPLELELIRLLLAGPAFGPAPALERLLIWGLAVVAPGVLLWRRAPDWASLLLVRIPAAKRTVDQRRISAIQQPLGLKAALIIGIALLLPMFWWIDHSALLVVEFSPTIDSSRLTALLIAAPLLALILWQWQQLVQAIWLLTRSDQTFADLTPINPADLQSNHLSLGLGLLQLPPLEWEETDVIRQKPETEVSENSEGQVHQSAADQAPDPQPEPAETHGDEDVQEDEPVAINKAVEVISVDEEHANDTVASSDFEAIHAEQQPLEEPCNDDQKLQSSANNSVAGGEAEIDQPSVQPSALDSAPSSQTQPAPTADDEDLPEKTSEITEVSSAKGQSEAESAVAAVTIEPEQPAEEHHSPDLDGQVSADNTVTGTDAETHHEKAETTGSEQGDPEQPAQPPPRST
ncbi:putative conserved membrane protein [Synechococcus sp. BIOS-E4-1]|nr:putative conserved membrane protein [Synechococcus sp. BIOS-E4-1]